MDLGMRSTSHYDSMPCMNVASLEMSDEPVINLLRKGYSIRDVAKLSGKGVSTVQRVKRLLKMLSPQ